MHCHLSVDDDDDDDEEEEQTIVRHKTRNTDGSNKDKIDSELLIEPKSEYEDGNDEAVEDLTMADEELMEDLEQAGPSHGGEGSSQGKHRQTTTNTFTKSITEILIIVRVLLFFFLLKSNQVTLNGKWIDLRMKFICQLVKNQLVNIAMLKVSFIKMIFLYPR